MMNEEEAFIVLNSIPFLGPAKIRLLVNHFGTARSSLKASAQEISQFKDFESIVPFWKQWEKKEDWKKELKLIKKSNVTLIPFTSPNFPKHLSQIPDCPALLYVKGTLLPQDFLGIAIVGTRQPTIYGSEMAYAIASKLALSGVTVVSGLARGIDTQAHQGALKTGRTLAVIGSGLSAIYPKENHKLSEEITEKGALITEFSMMTPPDKKNFPQRNRIVSGMTQGVVLIEAPIKSGAMITMNKGYAQKKKLFALPGRADSDHFTGNHLLIKERKAHLIENGEDILSHLGQLSPDLPTLNKFTSHLPPFDSEELELLKQMPVEEIDLESLALIVKNSPSQLLRILMGLILKRAVKEYPGKIYKKTVSVNL